MLAGEPLATLSRVAAGHESPVALVGGAVRDALLGRPVDDLDLVVQEDLESFLDRLAAEVGRRPVAIGDRFQDTHRLRLRGRQIDIARSMGDIEHDLQRRDFTINALAVVLPAASPPGVLDPAGGVADLEHGVLRETAPGVLAADPLRLMRAVRYATVLEDFELEARTLGRVVELSPLLESVAVERIRYEWQRILEAEAWVEGLGLAAATGLTGQCFGSTPSPAVVEAWARHEEEADPVVRLAALLVDLAADAGLDAVERRLMRLRWPKRPARSALRIARWTLDLPTDDPVAAALALEDPDAAGRAGALASAIDSDDRAAVRLRDLAARAREPRWVQGADLRRWGMDPGQALGEALQEAWVGQLLARWDDRDACRAWARRRASAGGDEHE